MTTAIWNGRNCEVRVERDLESNWAVSILSGERDPRPAEELQALEAEKARAAARRAAGAKAAAEEESGEG